MLNSTTIEERVTLLEVQVDDLTGDLDALEGEVTTISSDQITQDQRILELQVESDGKDASTPGINGQTSSPNHPRSNGFVERLVGVAKKLMDKAGKEEKPWISGLFDYRVTPQSGNIAAPLQLTTQHTPSVKTSWLHVHGLCLHFSPCKEHTWNTNVLTSCILYCQHESLLVSIATHPRVRIPGTVPM